MHVIQSNPEIGLSVAHHVTKAVLVVVPVLRPVRLVLVGRVLVVFPQILARHSVMLQQRPPASVRFLIAVRVLKPTIIKRSYKL